MSAVGAVSTVRSTAPLSTAELRRYGRHLALPEVGPVGQAALKRARVVLVGAGGLGSPIALYLAAAGVGTIGLVDDDVVDLSNLQRQILYGEPDLGRPKLEAAAARLAEVNPHTVVEAHPVRLSSANALEILRRYDIVVDGSDNFPTRYLVNDACVLLGKPDVYGSIFRFEGQVAVFWGARGPCYRCLFAEPPPPGLVPSCVEGGVLGVLPGVIGALQASEVIKLIVGAGEPLIGKLLVFDALTVRMRQVRVPKDPACPICSVRPTITRLQDYDALCGAPVVDQAAAATAAGNAARPGHPGHPGPTPREIAPLQLRSWLAEGRALTLVDVREPWEIEIATLPGARSMPLGVLPERWNELPTTGALIVYCHLGVRSAHAVAFLREQGLGEATSLAGGLDAWSREADPGMPRY